MRKSRYEKRLRSKMTNAMSWRACRKERATNKGTVLCTDKISSSDEGYLFPIIQALILL
jgi:hypothetical protein